jgi:hypothetical protein
MLLHELQQTQLIMSKIVYIVSHAMCKNNYNATIIYNQFATNVVIRHVDVVFHPFINELFHFNSFATTVVVETHDGCN